MNTKIDLNKKEIYNIYCICSSYHYHDLPITDTFLDILDCRSFIVPSDSDRQVNGFVCVNERERERKSTAYSSTMKQIVQSTEVRDTLCHVKKNVIIKMWRVKYSVISVLYI